MPNTPNSKATWFECGFHELKYRADRAGCPVCSLDKQLQEMRHSLKEAANALERTVDENRRLNAQVYAREAIREASSLLNEDDTEFFKTVLYLFRDSKSVSMKVTHGGLRHTKPNGFVVIPRKGDPWGHACESMGGLAIAQYFDQEANAMGGIKAMEVLSRGLAHLTPGNHDA